jgi:hypothetical protein
VGFPDARLLRRNFRILQAELMNVGINAPGDELGWHSLVEVSQPAVKSYAETNLREDS